MATVRKHVINNTVPSKQNLGNTNRKQKAEERGEFDALKSFLEKVEEMDESKMIKVEIEMPSYTLKTGPVVTPEIFKVTPTPFLPGMKEPEYYTPLGTSQEQPLSMPEIPSNTMEAANRGEKPVEIAPKKMLAKRVQNKKNNSGPINVSKLKSKLNRNKGKRGKR